ncbi:MAG: hypothetical protein H7067_13680 [Burkholderiales bacterium]|nr:hypothetical protein [Opitutaceae bacterium]
MPTGYELQENGRVTGPHSLAVLRQKAEIRVLHPDSLVRLATAPTTDASAPPAATPWLPILDLPELHADLFPARATPKLSTTPATFESANIVGPTDHVPATGTDVFAMLRQNSARERAATDELMKDLGPRPNNRRRDYIVCFLALNLFVACAGHFVGYVNPFLIGLAVMGNIALVWLLYFVMDRY